MKIRQEEGRGSKALQELMALSKQVDDLKMEERGLGQYRADGDHGGQPMAAIEREIAKKKESIRRLEAEVGEIKKREYDGGFEGRVERSLNELLRPAERGPGVDAAEGLESPFVDLSMSGPQRRPGQVLRSSYEPPPPGVVWPEFKW